MTGRCPRIALQLRPKFHSLFLQNSFDFQKSATFKALKSSPRTYTDVSFNPENDAFSRMEKRVSEWVSEWVSDRQSDYCNPLALARWGLIIIIIIRFFRRIFLGVYWSNHYITYSLVTNFPEIFTFIIGFSFTVWTKKSAKNIRKQVRGSLQNLYQAVAIHLGYVLLVHL